MYTFPYTKNKSKRIYCHYYFDKIFLYFSLFIFPAFQSLSCNSYHMENFYFLGILLFFSHLFGDPFFIFMENTLKHLKEPL